MTRFYLWHIGKHTGLAIVCALALVFSALSQIAPQERIIGEVTAITKAGEILTVKEDGTGNEYQITLQGTKTFLRIPPGEKDLKKATRITAADIGAGDRVAVRGKRSESDPKMLEAASILLIKAAELEAKRASEREDWQKRGSAGTVASINLATREVTMTVRRPEGPKSVVIEIPESVKPLRYAPDSAKFSDAKPGTLAELQVGDPLRVLGNQSADGNRITAEQLISGAFRTVTATITSLAPDGKTMTVNDLETKQPVTIQFATDLAIRRLPPPMATMLARRLNSRFQRGEAEGDQKENNTPPARAMSGPPAGRQGSGTANGDITQILERLPKISIGELKPGDVVAISGGVSTDKTRMTAINVIAGVEPLLQLAPPRRGQNAVADMWNLDMGVPEQ